jgi:hypothetical protein
VGWEARSVVSAIESRSIPLFAGSAAPRIEITTREGGGRSRELGTETLEASFSVDEGYGGKMDRLAFFHNLRNLLVDEGRPVF